MSTKEATDLSGSRRRSNGPKAGSVWESRMKIDEITGGIKVFNTKNNNSSSSLEDITTQTNSNTVISNSDSNPVNCRDNNSTSEEADQEMENKNTRNVMKPKQSPTVASAKRRTWNKSDNSDASPLQIVRQRSELVRSLDKDPTFSPDGIKKSSSPVIKRTRSVVSSSSPRRALDFHQSSDGNVKSDFNEVMISDGNVKSDSNEVMISDGNSKNVPKADLVEHDIKNCDDDDEAKKESDSNEVVMRSDNEGCKEIVLFEEKVVTSNDEQIKKNNKSEGCDDNDNEIEVGNYKSADVKEINAQQELKKPKKVVIEEKISLIHNNEKSVPVSPVVKRKALNHAHKIHPSPVKLKPDDDHIHGTPRKTSRLKSFVDLIMWRDVSKSALIFGIGTFAIISSSYTKDLNISFISVVSYIGLVYLSAIFLFRSLISRVASNVNNNNIDQDCVIGEEEAVWVVKIFLPYLNEFLLKLRALFSGDPATTMKLSVLLFILARCGSSITIWKMAKLGFIGVFTVPKICSSYSSQLTAFGAFWIRRFGDAWDSCSHKKAVGFAIFTLVWNLSSVLARIWAVFMLFVAFKYYQQYSLIRSDGGQWAKQEEEIRATNRGNSTSYSQGGRINNVVGRRLNNNIETSKLKKGS